MNAYFNGTRLRRAIGAAAVALVPLAGCSEVDRSLAVVDPDIINPEDTQSPAAAGALRLGALARHSQATSGGESFWLLGGLMADEWRSSDTFVQRDQTDQRSVETNNGNVNGAFRATHRARLAADVAARALTANEADPWQIAEMYVLQAYAENDLAENMCSGIPFSTLDADGNEVFGAPLPTADVLARALAHADSALTFLGTEDDDDSERIRNAAAVIKGRILMNQGDYAAAAAAVAGVPTDFEIVNEHSQTSRTNQVWALNNSAGRWTVSNGEGGNGLDFVVGDPRVPVCKGTTTTHTPTAGFTEVAACGAGYSAGPFDGATPVPFLIQEKWEGRESPAAWANGIEARLIEAEAQFDAGNVAGALLTLNNLRGTVPGLAPLVTVDLDTIFRERAFWLFGTGHRLGDLRRLIRQYGRGAEQVFPTGEWYLGAPYGTDVNFPIPQSEENNPEAGTGGICIDRNA